MCGRSLALCLKNEYIWLITLPMIRFSIVSISIASLILSSCGDKSKKSAKAAGAPQTYSELTLEPRSATIFNDFPATIEGIEIVQLRPMVDGYLGKVYGPAR